MFASYDFSRYITGLGLIPEFSNSRNKLTCINIIIFTIISTDNSLQPYGIILNLKSHKISPKLYVFISNTHMYVL